MKAAADFHLGPPFLHSLLQPILRPGRRKTMVDAFLMRQTSCAPPEKKGELQSGASYENEIRP